MTQSQAILRHLARKFRLEGESERERCMADMLVDQLSDFRASLVTLCYTPSFSQDLLQQWVSASGSYSSAQSLERRIDTFERFYQSQELFYWFLHLDFYKRLEVNGSLDLH